jgi:SAM-dependent methyltransferase
VGSGPAIDVERAMRAIPAQQRQSIRATLLDLDGEALEAATQRLSNLMATEQITPVRDNLYRLADKPRSAAPPASADFLICSGFFDYLPDDSAAAMLRLFWNSLAPGGRLVVGNFAPHNPTRAFMEWIGNWYLLYRTWEDLQDLAQRAGIPDGSYRIGAEQLGIDLFLIADRPH